MDNGFSLADAFGPSAFDRTNEHYALFYALGHGVWGCPLGEILALVDSGYPGGELQGEPGWLIERQMEIGEPQRRAQRLLTRFPHGGQVIKDPGPTAGPDPTWPAWARFKVELYEPDEFDNPKYPLRYYDAATFEGFLKKILTVYLKYHPESGQQVEQILANAHYWVEHDAKHHGRGI
jgi:hypothetical protein